MGVALTSASMIAAGPAVVAGPPVLTHTVTSVELLASPDEISDSLVDLLPLFGWLGDIDLEQFDGLAPYVAFVADLLRSTIETLADFGTTVDSWLEPMGISGLGDWIGGQVALLSPMLDTGWDAVAWLTTGFPEVIGNVFTPMAEFDLDGLYTMFGLPEETFDPLNELASVGSSILGGLTSGLMMGTVAPVGIVAQILAGNLDLADLQSLPLWENIEELQIQVQQTFDSLSDQLLNLLMSLSDMVPSV
ncbi:hypothetical protein [Mycolicibacter longobardus]|uniref:Uncharacterized protein n=1 Tax=Mycolicibacter longobardus TaxID=1108812 RepID=A0A1X1YID0_9MYCO|nr:hypothetical protein [Mycolicibacter longobardus]MCV7384817.1 hypothetical protein [Mycolicibacter longobardus]ORW10838.1 hypothetical protein AWC16_12180 [Mycolicibacter longobardus]